ncbi:hypothetical protein TeGR_g4751 [Tetraparma gracilis]|uniref:Uncharacterized protein n=1 Tax=Tetraparma gracilis TaxID=2962635 RepID=A0ABQ6MTT2_9STRA|nr:hypothetical protein TeGR_g4751 [Tetraparma gracilis]
MKRGDGIFSHGYRRRFLVLTSGAGGAGPELKYYAESGSNSEGEDLHGSIGLAEDAQVKVFGAELEVLVPSLSSRVWKLKMELAEDAAEWGRKIRAACGAGEDEEARNDKDQCSPPAAPAPPEPAHTGAEAKIAAEEAEKKKEELEAAAAAEEGKKKQEEADAAAAAALAESEKLEKEAAAAKLAVDDAEEKTKASSEEKKASAMWSSNTTFMMEKIDGMRRARNACDVAAARDMPEGLMNAPGLASIPSKPEQPPGSGKDLGELRGKAPVFLDVLSGGLVDFLTSMGIDPESEVSALNEEGATKTFRALTMAPLKTAESCTRKMTDDYDGDHTKLCDVVRCSITRSTERELAAVLEALVDGKIKGKNFKVTVVRHKNRFVEVLFTGIRDCLLNVLVEVEGHGGHVCEIQLHLAGILALKGYCHKYYEIFRDIFKRLDMFEKVGDVGGGGGGVERGLRRLLEGEDVEKLKALRELAGVNVLGDPKLFGLASDRIVELTREEETAEAALALYNKGWGQYQNEEYDAALVSYGKALAIYTKLEGEGGSSAISTRQDIAMVCGDKGEHERALEEYEVALKLSKASSDPKRGEEGERTAIIINNMGAVHKKMKNYDKALELLKRGLEMKEKAGAEKADILDTVGELAQTYDTMGRCSEAVEWYERGLAGEEAELGKNHPSTLISVYNLAIACDRAGDLDRAVELFERCLKADEEGGNDDYAIATADDLGIVLKDGGAKFAAKLAALKQKYPSIVERCGTTEEKLAILEPRLKAAEENKYVLP